MLSIVLLISLAVSANAQQRWYYTGQFRNNEVIDEKFAGSSFSPDDLHGATFRHVLFYGGIVSKSHHTNISDYEEVLNVARNDLLGVGNASNVRLLQSVDYPMYIAKNYGSYMATSDDGTDVVDSLKFMGEVGLYDHQRRVFLEKYWRDIVVGEIKAIEVAIANESTAGKEGNSDITVPDLEVELSASGDTSLAETPVIPSIVEVASPEATDSTGEEVETVPPVLNRETASNEEVHRLVYTSDLMGRNTIYAHTWSSSADDARSAAESRESAAQAQEAKNVRIMSYNLWHNNPPSWVYHNPRERWDRYHKRLSHFADVIVAEDPDIIALQEVRLDATFVSQMPGGLRHWNDLNVSKIDGGNQAEHVLSYLAQARAKQAHQTPDDSRSDGATRTSGGYYQFVFQPAMSMLDNQRLSYRNEEGVMILSKFPIVDYRVILLPRKMNDPSDDHQRAVLSVKVRLPVSHVHVTCADGQSDCSAGAVGTKETTIDVMTSHFSLSPRARNEGVRALMAQISDAARASPVQVLTGDFNAEPHEEAIFFLLSGTAPSIIKGVEPPADTERAADEDASTDLSAAAVAAATVEAVVASDAVATPAGSDGESTQTWVPFVDAWQHVRARQQVVAGAADASEVEVSKAVAEGYTFPACSPVKRIDFVLVRNITTVPSDDRVAPAGPRVHAEITDFRIVGTRPTASTEHLVGSREGLGMLDKDSPIWASDHFAVVTDLKIVNTL